MFALILVLKVLTLFRQYSMRYKKQLCSELILMLLHNILF